MEPLRKPNGKLMSINGGRRLVQDVLEFNEAFNLKATLESGQAFNWGVIPDGKLTPAMLSTMVPGTHWYWIVSGSDICLVNQTGPVTVDIKCFEYSLGYWHRYFGTDMMAIQGMDEIVGSLYRRGKISLDTFKKLDYAIRVTTRTGALHVLNQEPWDALVAFIVSQRNRVERIKSQVWKIGTFGEPTNIVWDTNYFGEPAKGDYDLNHGAIINTFPTAEQILRVQGNPEQYKRFHEIGLGYREKYLFDTAKELVLHAKRKCWPVNDVLSKVKLDHAQARIEAETVVDFLKSHKGVGDKVAACTALYGFGCQEVFPVDVWIQRMMDEGYIPENPADLFGSLSGVIQLHLFEFARRTKIGKPVK